VTYFIWDLPQAIPRNVGRSLKADLMARRPTFERSSTTASAAAERKRIAGASGAPASQTRAGELAQAIDSAVVVVANKASAVEASSSASASSLDFISAHAAQLSREVRKVLRLAAWGQIEVFRRATDRLERACKTEEKKVEGAEEAIVWAGEVEGKAAAEREVVRAIQVEKMA